MVDPSPIHAVPLREQVYERLQEMLIARTLPPGGHLVEERLAGQLGVSRGPVREALQRLHRDGWVTLRPRYGAFVNQPTPQEVYEFFEARELLESWAASLAAQRCTDGDGAALLRICDEADEGLRSGRPAGEMAALTARFHTTVLETARNHILLEFGRQLSHRSRWFFAPLVSSLAPRAWDEHREVAELIGAGRAEEAAAAMRTHISESRDAYLQTQPVAPDDGPADAVPAGAVPAAARLGAGRPRDAGRPRGAGPVPPSCPPPPPAPGRPPPRREGEPWRPIRWCW